MDCDVKDAAALSAIWRGGDISATLVSDGEASGYCKTSPSHVAEAGTAYATNALECFANHASTRRLNSRSATVTTVQRPNCRLGL